MKTSILKIDNIWVSCRAFFAQLLLAALFSCLWALFPFSQAISVVVFLICFSLLSAALSQYLSMVSLSSKRKEGPQYAFLPDGERKLRDTSSLMATFDALSSEVVKKEEKYEEEKKEKEAIIESLEEGVIVVDAEMKISYANTVGAKMLGISKRHLIGRPFPLLVEQNTASLLGKCQELLIKCQQHESIVTDSLSLGEGRKIYLDLISSPKEKGKGAILILQNKSSNFKILEMGKDFVANASHELRTPITIIKGFAETLQDLPELSPEMLSDITEKIVRNCERMDKLVKNLLTLADIENLPESRFLECDLLSLVENCRHLLLSVYPDCIVEVEKNCDAISILADADILELAIANLLDNAAKYSQAPAHITIKLEQLEEEVKIVIADKGIGIPQTDLEHIFERFYTVNKARSRRLGGAGLGLSLVKTIVERHDGIISVKSILSQGTSFTIFLPRKRQKKS